MIKSDCIASPSPSIELWEPRCAAMVSAQVDTLVCMIQEAERAEALQCIDELLDVCSNLMENLCQGLRLPTPAQKQARFSQTLLFVS